MKCPKRRANEVVECGVGRGCRGASRSDGGWLAKGGLLSSRECAAGSSGERNDVENCRNVQVVEPAMCGYAAVLQIGARRRLGQCLQTRFRRPSNTPLALTSR